MLHEKINQKHWLSGLILAGGKGSRVADQDKGLLDLRGKSLIERQIDWLRPQVNQIMISANRNLTQYQQFGYPVLSDKTPGFAGPMEGILQGLNYTQDEWLFVLPVDVPFLPENTIEKLKVNLSSGASVYYLASAERSHYLLMLIHKSQRSAVEHFITRGQKRVRDFLFEADARKIELDIPESHFANLNKSEDFIE